MTKYILQVTDHAGRYYFKSANAKNLLTFTEILDNAKQFNNHKAADDMASRVRAEVLGPGPTIEVVPKL